MTKLLLPALSLLLLSLVPSQAQTADGTRHKHHTQTEADKAAVQPAPPAPPPIADWFGKAVDEILTGADKALNLPPPNPPAPPAPPAR